MALGTGIVIGALATIVVGAAVSSVNTKEGRRYESRIACVSRNVCVVVLQDTVSGDGWVFPVTAFGVFSPHALTCVAYQKEARTSSGADRKRFEEALRMEKCERGRLPERKRERLTEDEARELFESLPDAK